MLIDFENLQPELIETLDLEHFRVVVFTGANQPKVSVELAPMLQQLDPRVSYLRISGAGRNALDLHGSGRQQRFEGARKRFVVFDNQNTYHEGTFQPCPILPPWRRRRSSHFVHSQVLYWSL